MWPLLSVRLATENGQVTASLYRLLFFFALQVYRVNFCKTKNWILPAQTWMAIKSRLCINGNAYLIPTWNNLITCLRVLSRLIMKILKLSWPISKMESWHFFIFQIFHNQTFHRASVRAAVTNYELWTFRAVANTRVIILLLECPLHSISGCKFPFPVAVRAVSWRIVGIYGNTGPGDFICNLPGCMEIDMIIQAYMWSKHRYLSCGLTLDRCAACAAEDD